jgi:hypothetical protein
MVEQGTKVIVLGLNLGNDLGKYSSGRGPGAISPLSLQNPADWEAQSRPSLFQNQDQG